MKINRQLVWDYPTDVPEDDEDFRRWYVARVLTRGGLEDIEALGMETIKEYFPRILVPKRIREFWEWYLGLTEPHGDSQREPTRGH